MMTSIADPLVLVLDDREVETTSLSSRSPSNLLIGSRLRARRASYGISVEEISEQLGIDHDALDLYETGTKRVNANLLLRIAEILDMKPDYFFRDRPKEEL